VRCTNCGTENDPGSRFCKECASPLAVSCPSCGASNAPDAKFCAQCATRLVSSGEGQPATAAPAASAVPPVPDPGPATPVAERRLVSVLFNDLVGFTTFSEGRDAEEVREVLTRYFDTAREIIERYGGTVEKFIGDAVMAVWGAPTAREDDAERAVRAALDLVAAVPSLGAGIQARGGVLTGEAAVTIGATNQGMVAGDIVNTAARLQSVAEPGTVLVGESTMQAAQGAIAFSAVGEATLKGKSSPVPAHRAVRVVAQRGGRGRSEGLEAPFVGRNEELRALKEALDATGRERRPRLVSIIGPAGIGKSRLAWEFLKYLDGVLEPIFWHSGRSPAYGEGISFWALGEMVRTRAGLAETDDEATTRARIGEMVAEHVTDDAERQWIEQAMLALLGVGEVPDRPEELFAAWRTFFERMAQGGTVLLAFEDLHWADAGLLDFIDHLLEWTRDLPICIVTLARPELLEKRPTWGAGKRQFRSIFLEPLPESAMRELLTGLVPGLPEAATAAIVARADGVPLYAVETVRMLVGQGRLTETDGVYVPAGDLSTLAVPDTLTALISARLDSLEPAERSLVQDAAVLGQSFTPEALAAVAGSEAAELEPQLRLLARRELLILRSDPRSPDRGQYAFVQALIREVAYNTLAHRDRKARHLAAARFFESLETDELAGALAGHYLSAYRNAGDGPDAAALAIQARIALKAAADRASALGANEQALRFLNMALEITTDPGDEADLAEAAGLASEFAGRPDEAIAHWARAQELRAASDDRVGTLRAITGRLRTMIVSFRAPEALPIFEATANEYADLAGDPGFVRFEAQWARAHMMTDGHATAVSIADRALEAAEHANLPDVIADAMITKGTSLMRLGRGREGLALTKAGGALAESLDRTETAVRAYINAIFSESLEDPRRSLATTRAGIELARRIGMGVVSVSLVANGASLAIRTGDWDWANAALEEILGTTLDPGHRASALMARANLADLRGLDDGRRHLQAEIEQLLAGIDDPNSAAALNDTLALRALAERRLADSHAAYHASALGDDDVEALVPAARLSLLMGDVDEARRDLAAAERAPGAFGRTIQTDFAAIRAGIVALEGRTGDAINGYRGALRAWRDLGLPWDEALTGLVMAAVLDATDPEVVQAIEASRRIFDELGAAPFVAFLDELTAGRQSSAPEPTTRDAAQVATSS
jgi:class 3 adenylate cyclase/tetratricopeptide (TPR) repeat protein